MTIMNGVVANLNAVIKFNPGKKDRPKMIKLEFGEGCKELSVSPSTLPHIQLVNANTLGKK